jgi:hypothetical protein
MNPPLSLTLIGNYSDPLKGVTRYLAPLILFAGGVWLLSLRLAGWSLLLGLPAIQIGIIFIILGFDNSAKKTLDLNNYHIVKCEVCDDPTVAPLGETNEVCSSCRAKKIKSSSLLS